MNEQLMRSIRAAALSRMPGGLHPAHPSPEHAARVASDSGQSLTPRALLFEEPDSEMLPPATLEPKSEASELPAAMPESKSSEAPARPEPEPSEAAAAARPEPEPPVKVPDHADPDSQGIFEESEVEDPPKKDTSLVKKKPAKRPASSIEKAEVSDAAPANLPANQHEKSTEKSIAASGLPAGHAKPAKVLPRKRPAAANQAGETQPKETENENGKRFPDAENSFVDQTGEWETPMHLFLVCFNN